MLKQLIKDLHAAITPGKDKVVAGFFKTGKGEYSEGEKFLGVMTPQMRVVAKKYKDLSFDDIKELIYSDWHEYRSVGFMILVLQYTKGDESVKKKVYDFYMKHLDAVNNWDHVDGTAPYISGPYLIDKDKSVLYDLVKSSTLWRRRVGIISTWYFIRQGAFDDTIALAELLLHDKQDLMHKAVGWMLREVGNKDVDVLESFLEKHAATMPRTMLRYAIEKFDKPKRSYYMTKSA